MNLQGSSRGIFASLSIMNVRFLPLKYIIALLLGIGPVIWMSLPSVGALAELGEKPVSLDAEEQTATGYALNQDREIYTGSPHQQLLCGECHREESGDPGISQISVNQDSIKLCRGCHDVEHLHPVGSATGSLSVEGSFSLPLGKGKMDGKIVCFTCHAIHQELPIPFLLRGNTKQQYSQVRRLLCRSCHGDAFSGISPHDKKGSACAYCHAAKPGKEAFTEPSLKQRDEAACSLCHPEISSIHYECMNPYIDQMICQEAVAAGNVLPDGRSLCSSCHEPHGATEHKALLTEEYFSRCAESRSVNPHWNDLLCLSCHSEKMNEKEHPLREGGDINKICNRCHHSGYARTEIHPVGILPSQHIRIPADMPMQEDKLTCLTCHDAKKQMGRPPQRGAQKRNPFFLRKKKASRHSYCFHCHVEETYKRLNPHIQQDERGEILKGSCLFCHASLPDVRFIGPEKVTFIVQDPNEYCIGCHHGLTKNHPAGVMHLIEPSDKIMGAIRTSVQRIGVELPLYKGKIVCATCHNPHQEGVIKIAAAATGTKRENKLRLKPGRRQCTGCHWDK